MTNKPPDFADLNTLAVEACDMWQEHLSGLASDPQARAELTRFLEPQRRVFADWAAMMQGASRAPTEDPSNERAAPSQPAAPETPRGPTYGDDALGLAQLALRVAELEKRVRELESTPRAPRTAKRTTP